MTLCRQRSSYKLARASVNAEDEAKAYLLEGAAQAYRKIASNIGKFLNAKGGEEDES